MARTFHFIKCILSCFVIFCFIVITISSTDYNFIINISTETYNYARADCRSVTHSINQSSHELNVYSQCASMRHHVLPCAIIHIRALQCTPIRLSLQTFTSKKAMRIMLSLNSGLSLH